MRRSISPALPSAREKKKPFSILYTDLNYIQMLNETKGHAYGDSAIRWLALVLQEESHAPTYRIGGDDFAVLLIDGLEADHEELLHRILARLYREGEQLGIPSPPAKIALIHYERDHNISINDVLFQLWEAIRDVKHNQSRTIKIFDAQELIKSTARAEEQSHDTINRSWELLQSIANNAIHRMVLALVLQPLVENAVYHGIEPLPGGGTVVVRGAQDGRFVELSVENPVDASRPRREGGSRIGLDNVRQRLDLTFPGEGTLRTSASAGRFIATLRFPVERPAA